MSNTQRRNKALQNIVLSAVFASMTVILTYFVKIPIPMQSGYVHLGDVAIYLSACFLPTPLAIISAGIGGALSDGLSGFALYIIPTFIIKALITLAFSSREKKIICKKNIFAVILSIFISVIGYYVADTVITFLSASAQNLSVAMTSAIADIFGNAIQSVTSAIIFILLASSLDKIKINRR